MKTTNMALAVISLLTNSNTNVLAAHLKNHVKTINMDDDLAIEKDNNDEDVLKDLDTNSESDEEIKPSNRKYHDWESEEEENCEY